MKKVFWSMVLTMLAVVGLEAQSVPAVTAVPANSQEAKANLINENKIGLLVDECEVSDPLPLFQPVFAAEGDLDGHVYDDNDMLKEEVISKDRLVGVEPIWSENADGWIQPAKAVPAPKAPYFRIYRFRVAADIFTPVTIRVKCPQKSRIFVGDRVMATKNSAENSQDSAGELTCNLNVETRSYDIYVKALVRGNEVAGECVKVEIETKKGVAKTGLRFLKNSEKRRLCLADYNENRRVYDAQISPNGKFVLLKYSELQPDGSRAADYEVRDLETNSIVNVNLTAGTTAAWMPAGGARLAWKSSRDGRARFFEHNLETHTVRLLAEDLPEKDNEFFWLHDESGILIRHTDHFTENNDQWRHVENISDRRPGYRDRRSLYLYKFSNKVMTRLTAGHHDCNLQAYSLDSKRILVTTMDIDYSFPEYTRNNLYDINVETGELTALIEKEPYSFVADYSPDCKKLLILAPANFKNNLGSALPEGVYPNSFDMQLYIMDLQTREIEAVSKDFDPNITRVQWGGDGNIYLVAEDRDRSAAFVYNVERKTFTKLPLPLDSVYKISVIERPEDWRPIAIAVGGCVNDIGKCYALDLNTQVVKGIYKQPQEFGEYIELGTVKDWNFVSNVPGSEGDTITGYYYLPPRFDPEKKYPMIVYYYGGTSPTLRGFNAHYPYMLWASHGYIVYIINPSGATGFGQKFAARHVNAWGRLTADEIIQGTKQFCDEHPFVNREKIGCIGASYGGFMTMYLQTRTDIFAAAVSHAGISNIASYWGGGYWGVAYNAVAAAKSQPWNARDVFVEQSPLFYADRIKTPILFCHGQKDTNVPPHESHQMFAALRLLGKTTELITFKDEDHGIMDYKRRVQWGKSQMAWFDRFLKDDPDWWFELWPSNKKLFND